MINYITLKNFKAFQEASIELGNLTLFTGVNGVGKSSFIQSLLLLRQSHKSRLLPNQVTLANDYLQLGKSQDVFNIYASSDDFLVISLDTTSGKIETNIQSELSKTFLQVNSHLPTLWNDVEKESLFNNAFQYLYAEREAPKENFPVDQYSVEEQRSIGNKGQFTAHFIAKYSGEKVKCPSLIDKSAISDTLLAQIDVWLSKISKGIRLIPKLYEDLGIARLSYQFSDNDDLTPEFSPNNVGFGFTYALPVITALLASKPGDLIIIENPESHLHPKGQSQMGEMLALAAQDGVQVIIETHSDHVLNGIRVATKRFHENSEEVKIGKGIDANKIKIYFFERQTEKHNTQIVPIKVDKKGRLSSWPKAFFDEWNNMLDELLD